MSNSKDALAKVCEAISSKKGENLIVLDVRQVTSFTDYFVLCSGDNRKQNQAISDEIRKRLKEEHGTLPASLEGYDAAEWILMDYIDFVIHIFSERARNFYKLEKLWSDGIAVQPQLLSA